MKTFTVESSWGLVTANAETGDVLPEESRYDRHDADEDYPIQNIFRFDVAEWRRTYPGEELAGTSQDILDFGYWFNRKEGPGYQYTQPAYEWREEFVSSLRRGNTHLVSR